MVSAIKQHVCVPKALSAMAHPTRHVCAQSSNTTAYPACQSNGRDTSSPSGLAPGSKRSTHLPVRTCGPENVESHTWLGISWGQPGDTRIIFLQEGGTYLVSATWLSCAPVRVLPPGYLHICCTNSPQPWTSGQPGL